MESKPDVTLPRVKSFLYLIVYNLFLCIIKELNPSTLKGCWKNVWSALALDRHFILPVDTEISCITNVEHICGFVGFSDMAKM